MDSESTGYTDENKATESGPMQNDEENQSIIKSGQNDAITIKSTDEPMETDEPLDDTVNNMADDSLDVSARSEGRMGLRRAKTKGELKKQLELKRGKLRSSLPEANDSDSIPSPHSANEQKQLDSSMLKITKELPESTIKWTEGDMFWGRVTGHPWWPCMVFKDPIQMMFTRMMRVNVRAYHFHFFGTSCERGWVIESSMMAFEGRDKFDEIRKEKMEILSTLKAKSKSEKNLKLNLMSFDIKSNRISSWKSAVEEAEKVFAMEKDDRMKYVTDLLSSKKKNRRDSSEGAKRKREEQGDELPKKKSRKSEGPLKAPEEADESKMEDDVDVTMETNNEVSIIEGNKTSEPTNEHNDEQTTEIASSTPNVSQTSKITNHIEATPERAVATRYKLRAVRKLKKLTDDEEEEDEGDSKARNRKLSVTSATADENDNKSEDSQSASGIIGTKPIGGVDAVRTLEIFKLTHNSNNHKKEEVCIRCESSHQGVIKCKGPCHAPLHPACVGVSILKDEEGEGVKEADFICDECREGQHTCFICKIKDNTTVKCGVNTCCFYYHSTCLKKLKYVKHEKNQAICPMHVCISCAADSEKTHLAGRGRFFKCIRCPNSYHTGDYCIAAGSVVLSNTWIICGDHQTSDSKKKHQDHLNAAFCFSCGQGGSLVCCESCPASYHTECCEEKPPAVGKWNCELCTDGKRPLYGEIVWCKAGVYRWWPGEVCHPRNIPTNIQNLPHGIGEFPVYFFGSNDYLWTHKGRVFSFQEGDKGTKQGQSKHLIGAFNKALEDADDAARIYYEERNKKEQKLLDKKPTPYRHVKSNVPIGNVEIYKVPLSEVPRCQCNATMDNPCGADTDCINRLMMYECDASVCLGEDRCLNRSIQTRNDADTEVFRTPDNRGWGLRSKVNLPKGHYIHEYVGDLVDEEECRKRLAKAKEQNISNFYMLTLDKNRIIDAGPKGNNSRFMNHSCRPNCETQKWFVNGDARVALFALRDVKAGEELTFNYNLECLGDKKTVCNCGTPVCSGFLGERPKSSPTDEKTQKLQQKKNRKKQKNVSKLAPVHEDTCFRCGNPGELVLCDKVNCTKSYHLKCLKLNQLPRGKWICPWHLCDEEKCGKWAAKLCSMCPNSFCSRHSEGNIFTLGAGRIVCDEHPPTCPQLQYLLAQDELELDRKKEEKQDEDEKDEETKTNGDVKINESESPFPLVSTPFPKKGRGRPPKHKLGESPIVASSKKVRTIKTSYKSETSVNMEVNSILEAEELFERDELLSPTKNATFADQLPNDSRDKLELEAAEVKEETKMNYSEDDLNKSGNAQQSPAVDGHDSLSDSRDKRPTLDRVKHDSLFTSEAEQMAGKTEESIHKSSESEESIQKSSESEESIHKSSESEESIHKSSESEESIHKSSESGESIYKSSESEESSSPLKKQRPTDHKTLDVSHNEKLSNGFSEDSDGPTPRPSIHRSKKESNQQDM